MQSYNTFYLQSGCLLTKKEEQFIDSLNTVIKNYHNYDISRYGLNFDIMNIESVYQIFSNRNNRNDYSLLAFSTEKYTEHEYFLKRQCISALNIYKENIMLSQEDFIDFIERKKIDIIFRDTIYLDLYDFLIDENSIDLYDEEDELWQIVKKIINPKIKLYNQIIKKIDFSVPCSKNYFCMYEGHIFLCVGNINESLEENFIIKLLILDSLKDIKEQMNDYAQKKEDERRREREEKDRAAIKRLEVIKKQIIDDENFKYCTQEKDRLQYLRNILTTEDDSLLALLDMSFTSTGVVRSCGVKNKIFINEIWENLKEKSNK